MTTEAMTPKGVTSNVPMIPDVGIADVNGEPRVKDVDIAERLGFDRPHKIREIIERNRPEFESLGALVEGPASTHGATRPAAGCVFWLSEEQALLVAVLSRAPAAPAVRSMLIKVFVAWRRGAMLGAAGANAEVRKVIGGIVKRVVHSELSAVVPSLVRAEIARETFVIRRGKTAGQIWREHGLPGIKNGARWLSFRLVAVGCAIAGDGRGELGLSKARLFDPDKAAAWMKNGGLQVCRQKVAERRGQMRLYLTG